MADFQSTTNYRDNKTLQFAVRNASLDRSPRDNQRKKKVRASQIERQGELITTTNLGNENGGHGFVQSCSIHVDGSSDGHHKARDSRVYFVVLFQTLHGNWQRGVTVIGKEQFIS